MLNNVEFSCDLLQEETPRAREARVELCSLILARARTRKHFYSKGLFLPAFEEELVLSTYNVSILVPACIVLVRDANPSCHQNIMENILEEALKSKTISKAALAVLKHVE